MILRFHYIGVLQPERPTQAKGAIANRTIASAGGVLGSKCSVHPNDHVNLSQLGRGIGAEADIGAGGLGRSSALEGRLSARAGRLAAEDRQRHPLAGQWPPLWSGRAGIAQE